MGVRYGSTVWEYGMGVRIMLWSYGDNRLTVTWFDSKQSTGRTVMGARLWGVRFLVCIDVCEWMGMDCFCCENNNETKY